MSADEVVVESINNKLKLFALGLRRIDKCAEIERWTLMLIKHDTLKWIWNNTVRGRGTHSGRARKMA